MPSNSFNRHVRLACNSWRMKIIIAITIFIMPSLARFCPAQDYGSANQSLEPWNQDFSYLADPNNRTDLLDPLKYIPLGKDPSTFLSLSGELRDRFNYFNYPLLGAARQDNGFNLLRVLVGADLHIGPNFRFFSQFDSSVESLRAGGPKPGDADNADLQQAFADITLPMPGGTSLVFRIGRQELIYGVQRLISPNDWRNVRQTFDGGKVSFFFPNDTLDVFVVRPVTIKQTQLDSSDDHTWFAGIYNVAELPDLISFAHTRLEAYLLQLDQFKSPANAVNSNTYTLGGRVHVTPGPWDFELEPDLQFGRRGGSQISAWSVASDVSYTFSDAPFSPRARLGLDLASGSLDPADRFNQLFGPQFIFLGHMNLIGRENLIDLHPGLSLDLTRDISLTADQHFFLRQNNRDAVYNLTGGAFASNPASRASYIGAETDVAITWQMQQHFWTMFGYSHFFKGSFLQSFGHFKDEDFAFAMMTFSF